MSLYFSIYSDVFPMPPSSPPTYAMLRVSKLPCLHSLNGSFRALPACNNWCEWSWQLLKSYSVWLDMSLKLSSIVLALFSFRISRRSRTTKPSSRCFRCDSPGVLYCSFFFGFGHSVQKRDAFYQSKADTVPHALTVRLPRNRKSGPGARAFWVGV